MKSQSLFGNRVRAVVAKILESWMEVIIKYIVGDATLSIFFSKALTKVGKTRKENLHVAQKEATKSVDKIRTYEGHTTGRKGNLTW